MAKVSKSSSCKHPLDDHCLRTLTMTARDFVMGTESLTVSYFCGQHRRHGFWTVKTTIPVPEAVRDWLDAQEEPPQSHWGG